MSSTSIPDKINLFLKTKAPFSVIDKGKNSAGSGQVIETTRYGDIISGVVIDGEDNFTVSLKIIGALDVEATCGCSNDEDMKEQWCTHAVALLVRSIELEFFTPQAGFSPQSALQKGQSVTPSTVASLIKDLNASLKESYIDESNKIVKVTPEVKIFLETSTDRLGVKVVWDDEAQRPLLFENLRKQSTRALDNMLITHLDSSGVWDSEQEVWYINSSSDIQEVFGIIKEYKTILDLKTLKRLKLIDEEIGARLNVIWHKDSVDFSVDWILPDGTKKERTEEVIGTGPLWAIIDNQSYILSETALKILALFPRPHSITLSRGNSGAIVESLLNDKNIFTNVVAEEYQPQAVVHAPQVILSLNFDVDNEVHFGAYQTVQANAVIDFEYPKAKDDAKEVYIPDRELEKQAVEKLISLGFNRDGASSKKFIARADQALDIVANMESFPKEWKIEGGDEARRKIRFADMSLQIKVDSQKSDADKKEFAKNSNLAGHIDWFECSLTLTQNNARIPLSTLFKSSKSEYDKWIRLDSGAFAMIPGGSMSELKSHLSAIDPRYTLSNSIVSKITKTQALSLSSWGAHGIKLSLPTQIIELEKKLRTITELPAVKIPKSFIGKLRPYQTDGVRWLSFLSEVGLGGVLADEMGLGKTVQALAFIELLKVNGNLNKPVLVIAPTSVVSNWAHEAHKFTPNLKVLLLQGTKRKGNFESIKDHDLVITSYALLRVDRDVLTRQNFTCVILDEAQNIKNPNTSTAQAAKALKADIKLALTGTPTENRPLELWSLFDFLIPGYLGTIDFFKNQIEKPILENATNSNATSFIVGKTKPFILRRTKDAVEKDLPPKTESVLYVPMTTSQGQLYTQILNEVRPKVLDAVKKKGVGGATVSILAALLRLRQICNHPNSIAGLTARPGLDSGKFALLQDLLIESLEAKRKILLFSQFLEMLSIIRRWLDKKGIKYSYLDGSTKDRQVLIDEFNNSSDIPLFLMSLKAGGTGVNLASADTVIIYDPWWNPAVESQAVDRAHRIGQTKPVNVYRLVTEDSVEEKIMSLKDKKSKITGALLGEDSGGTLKLTKTDIEALFAAQP